MAAAASVQICARVRRILDSDSKSGRLNDGSGNSSKKANSRCVIVCPPAMDGATCCLGDQLPTVRLILADPRHREQPKEYKLDRVFDQHWTNSQIFEVFLSAL